MHMRGRLVAAVMAAAVSAAAQVYPDCEKYSVAAADDYMICWDRAAAADPQATEMQFQVTVRTLGWFGFGIPEQTSGGMAGADMMVLEHVGGEAVLRDYHTVAQRRPTLDSCSQDWRLLGASQSNGATTVQVARRLEAATAEQDRSFVDGPMKIIMAYGSGATLAYHGANRRPAGIVFRGVGRPALPADSVGVQLLMKDYAVQAQRTTYACQSFDMAEYTSLPGPGSSLWAVRFEMLDTAKPRGEKYIVHHAGLYSCRYRSPQWQKYQTPGQCGMDAGVECGEVVFAWALGMGPLDMPAEAGFRVDQAANRFLVLEVHYDNPEQAEGVDSSGVLMTLSRTARQHEAGVLHIGDPFVGLAGRAIPSGAPYTVQTDCRKECTSTMPGPVTVFASHLHMHNIGKRIRVAQVRDGEVVAMVDRIDFWDFDFQGTNTVDRLLLLPGDELHTTCEYEKPSWAGPGDVRFGLATEDEMCMAYLYTYPAPLSYCGWLNESKYATTCGRADNAQPWVETQDAVADPAVLSDPAVPVVFGQTPVTCGGPLTAAPKPQPTAALPTPEPVPETPAPTGWCWFFWRC